MNKGLHSMANGNEQIREDRIRERAYEIWEREGRKYGDHERHWEEAEKELRKEESGIIPPRTHLSRAIAVETPIAAQVNASPYPATAQ